MRLLTITILLLFICRPVTGQQSFAFTHLTTGDGTGLASNLVTSLYQDEKGYIWVGTANGLQRFDGSKFIEINTSKSESDKLQHSRISQIIPSDSGTLVLAMFSLGEFGLFNPSTLNYKKIPLKPSRFISPRSEFRLWRDSRGEIYLNVQNYGILHYNKKGNFFADDIPFPFPNGWIVNLLGVYENVAKQQYWFASDSGICIYDKRSRQMWHKRNNPNNLAVLNNTFVQDGLTQIYIDKQQRIWLFGYPRRDPNTQYKFCLDSTGSRYLTKDTAGLHKGPDDYTEYKFFYETAKGDLWIYGLNVLFNYDKNTRRFHYIKSSAVNNNISVDYESVFQLLEDKDGNIWMATNQGIYYTATGSANSSIINAKFNTETGPTAITDLLETPDRKIWFTSWRAGITTTDQFLHKTENYVYAQPPPASWPKTLKASARQVWSIGWQPATKSIWLGCNNGVLLIHNPQNKTTTYQQLPEADNSTIRYIQEDMQGNMWLSTNSGRLIKYSNGQFKIVQDVKTIIFKIFFDKQGWLWLATRERGLYALDPFDGKVLQHYYAHGGKNSLYSNTGTDIEQLHNNMIVFSGGALNFINKNTGTCTILKYEDGLPSNTASRLRLDEKGFLWIITSNGLCRYNPGNHRITPYGRKDGVVLAEQTIACDFTTSNGSVIFAGSNSVVMFNPAIFSSTIQPPDVTITDFKIHNQVLPVDSVLQNPLIKLEPDQNSLTIFFASLSYKQKDKLTYYYKLEGVDKDWIKADRSNFVNYSLLPPGKYAFKIYCENIEGIRSLKTTELSLLIRPPYYRTYWFMSCILFVIALLIYAVHDLRVNRLLAVEALRNRVARDLHDDMGSTLSTINILSSMAKTKVNEDADKTHEYLLKISEYSERMMDAMDDIVWSIKPSNDSMQKITARMREFATNVLEAKEIEFSFDVDEEINDVKLDMEARRDFFLIFKEAVNNAAKYSKASHVIIQLTMQNKKLSLLVKDDGVGFNLHEADGNGLGNMQKRAENMNATVSIQSQKGEGATVKLAIPVL